ncbi:hypothetical protein ACK37B_19725, partial [Aeromonas veronii]
KAPSVTVTWGWGSHDCLADLGNNAAASHKKIPLRRDFFMAMICGIEHPRGYFCMSNRTGHLDMSVNALRNKVS